MLAGPTSSNTFSVPDCRSMVKTLVCGVKTITWGAGSCKVSGSNSLSCGIVVLTLLNLK